MRSDIVFEKNIFQFGRQAPSEQFKNKLVLGTLGACSLHLQPARLVRSFKNKLVLRAQELRACNALKTARTSHNLFLKFYSKYKDAF